LFDVGWCRLYPGWVMIILRLLADDLTGALDTAAEFVPLTGNVPVFGPNGTRLDPAASAALDSATRECDPATAMARVSGMVRLLEGADIAFKKIDSLLRGPTLAEIAACMHAGIWRHCALAPAFPYHGRVTRAGRQYISGADGEAVVGDDMVAGLRLLGVMARPSEPDSRLRPGVTVFDAETGDDLRRIVSTVQRCPEPVLWAGTGGLAQAITGRAHPDPAPLPRPILGLFGSDQPATADQLAACETHWLEIDGTVFDTVAGRLDEAGLVLISFRVPFGTARAAAAERIATGIGRLTARIEPPGTVVVAGGETLRSLCEAVGAASLVVQGRLVPGVARSVISGGSWGGVTVISKSGAFGHANLLRELIVERAG
jgi:uncharacterized protein YgbK (DUF1537 family)